MVQSIMNWSFIIRPIKFSLFPVSVPSLRGTCTNSIRHRDLIAIFRAIAVFGIHIDESVSISSSFQRFVKYFFLLSCPSSFCSFLVSIAQRSERTSWRTINLLLGSS